MKKHIFTMIAGIFAALCALGVSAGAEEGDYIVILKNEPLVSLAEDDPDILLHEGRIYVTDSLMAAYAAVPSELIEMIVPDETIYIPDYDEESSDNAEGISDTDENARLSDMSDLADDPYLGDQWHLDSVNVESAWRMGYNGSGVKIGIIDSGIKKPYHIDLPEPTQWYNVISGSDYSDVSDSLGHGTYVSGIIAAKTNNGYGVAGIANGADIMMFKVTDGKEFSASNLLLGMQRAINSGCDVINMSLGFTAKSASGTYSALKTFVDQALKKGMILVAAAGNDGTTEYQYPASYDGVISVASVGRAKLESDKGKGFTESQMTNTYSGASAVTFLPDEPSTFTQHNDKVVCAAPGYQILSTNKDGTFSRSSGTSFAAPVVSGAAAIAKQIKPDITGYEFAKVLEATSRDVYDDGYDQYTGCGIVDIGAIAEYLSGYEVTPSPEPTATPSPTPYITEEPTEPPTESVITYDAEKQRYVISAVTIPIPSGAKVYAALYKDERCVAVSSTSVMADYQYPRINCKYTGDIDYARIFVWNTADGSIEPLAQAQVVKPDSGN